MPTPITAVTLCVPETRIQDAGGVWGTDDVFREAIRKGLKEMAMPHDDDCITVAQRYHMTTWDAPHAHDMNRLFTALLHSTAIVHRPPFDKAAHKVLDC